MKHTILLCALLVPVSGWAQMYVPSIDVTAVRLCVLTQGPKGEACVYTRYGCRCDFTVEPSYAVSGTLNFQEGWQ